MGVCPHPAMSSLTYMPPEWLNMTKAFHLWGAGRGCIWVDPLTPGMPDRALVCYCKPVLCRGFQGLEGLFLNKVYMPELEVWNPKLRQN